MSFFRLLALSYLAWAAVFVVAVILVAHLPGKLAPSAGALTQKAGKDVAQLLLRKPQPRAVARLDLTPVVPPAPALDPRAIAHADVTPPKPRVVEEPEPKPSGADQPPSVNLALPALPEPPATGQIAKNKQSALPQPPFHIPQPPPATAAPSDQSPPPSPSGAAESTASASPRQAIPIPDPPPLDAPIFSRAQFVAARLAAGLTPEMVGNFDLFLYVSKADAGPVSQHLYVFEKQPSGELKLLHDWAVSTGREKREVNALGERVVTATPAGYYQLDPDRIYRSYHSDDWNEDMPDAMFFNWERRGVKTGLAIHAATGGDIALLGSRASAGCVRLAPKDAAILFDLIAKQYRGPVPRFAYDHDSRTMSNQGRFMHDRAGKLRLADGYRVLIRIENYGGDRGIGATLF